MPTHRAILILRADAGAEIGTGHVMRCLALAQAWQDAGGLALFVSSLIPAALVARLRRENIAVAQLTTVRGSADDAAASIALAHERGAAWVVLDGYCFDAAYAGALRSAGLRLLALDDMNHLDRYPVDILLNQNLSADVALYAGKVGEDTTLLLGPRYSLLRREFRHAPARTADATRKTLRVLVSFGGGDAENYSEAVLRNLAASGRRDLEVVVLAGAANPHVFSLEQLAVTLPFRCTVRVNVENVATIMAWADAAVTAAGSTVWELAAMQLPALIGAHEDNQLAGLAALQAVPFFRACPVAGLFACDLAAELSVVAATRTIAPEFDTQGAVRVVAALQSVMAPALLSA
jgi:UDP-2,4-diacetamido-2,4,6-trideoxy-beta-L-altropyranose hydrolase